MSFKIPNLLKFRVTQLWTPFKSKINIFLLHEGRTRVQSHGSNLNFSYFQDFLLLSVKKEKPFMFYCKLPFALMYVDQLVKMVQLLPLVKMVKLLPFKITLTFLCISIKISKVKQNIRNKNLDHSILKLGNSLEMLAQFLRGTGVSKRKNGLDYILVREYLYQPVGIFCGYRSLLLLTGSQDSLCVYSIYTNGLLA